MLTQVKVLAVPALLAALSGCGDTNVITERDRVIKREEKVDSHGNEKTTETIIRENNDGTNTKIEKKTETKVKDGDTIVKLPGIEIKKD